jgi:hypothetical protein
LSREAQQCCAPRVTARGELGSCPLRVGYADYEALAKCLGGSGNGIERYGYIARVEETIELGATGVKLLGHGSLGLLLFPHGLLQLPRQHTLEGNSLNLCADAFGFEEIIEG